MCIRDRCGVDKYVVEESMGDGRILREEHSIKASKVPSRGPKMNTHHTYSFRYRFNPENIKAFAFKTIVSGVELSFSPAYFKFSGFVKSYHRETIPIGNFRLKYSEKDNAFKILKNNGLSAFIDEIKKMCIRDRY